MTRRRRLLLHRHLPHRPRLTSRSRNHLPIIHSHEATEEGEIDLGTVRREKSCRCSQASQAGRREHRGFHSGDTGTAQSKSFGGAINPFIGFFARTRTITIAVTRLLLQPLRRLTFHLPISRSRRRYLGEDVRFLLRIPSAFRFFSLPL